MKPFQTIIYILFLSLSLQAQTIYHLPKVLYLTSGADVGRGTVSDGIVYALQAFNRQGVQVRLENRKILLEPGKLAQYDLMFVPTIAGYHDTGMKYGLTYMSDIELKNIVAWLKNGGFLVTDVNMGRNDEQGKDRIAGKKELNKENYPLAGALGVTLQELNTENWQVTDTGLHIFKHPILNKKHKHPWRLVPLATDSNTQVLAEWQTSKQFLPAITLHQFGKGKVLLLPDFYILHPLDDGGLASDKELNKLYDFIYKEALPDRKYPVQISPWKEAHNTVYCQTFDDGGNKEQYQRIFDFINRNELPTVFFVTPNIDKEIISELQAQKRISLQGHSYSHPDFRKLNYEQTYREFLQNQAFWNKKFKGFRFPYVSNSFWGMYWLNELGFLYDTSIAANNMEFIRGPVVPYNIPIFKDDYYLTLDVLEISQIYRSDWYFYQKSLENEPYTQAEQQADAKRFEAYLKKYYDEVVTLNKGVMVYLGHPMYAGYSETSLQALQNFIDYLKTKDVWIASVNEVAERWNKLRDLQVNVTENKNKVALSLDLPGQEIKALGLQLPAQPHKISTSTPYQIKQKGDKTYLILDISGHLELTLQF